MAYQSRFRIRAVDPRSYSHWFAGALCQCDSIPRSLAVPRRAERCFGETIVEASKNGGWTVENGGKIQENGANTREDHWEHGDWEVFDAS